MSVPSRGFAAWLAGSRRPRPCCWPLGAAAALLRRLARGLQALAPVAISTNRSPSYPGWIQARIPPDKFNFAAYTVISDFGLDPTLTGGICLCDLDSLFISNIVSFVSRYGFDGVDVDWEEQVPQNRADYIALVKGLRSALNAAFPGEEHLPVS